MATAEEVIMFAAKLRDLLLAHEKAETQLNMIEAYISELTNRVFRTNLDGRHGVLLNLLTKKSIATGIKKAYQQYKQRKLQHIQELSAHILHQLSPEGAIDDALPPLSNPIGPLSDSDELVSMVTDTFKVISRSV